MDTDDFCSEPQTWPAMAPQPGPTYAISAVERETGLSKDTLRMWERRYGFPLPSRDSKGERVYSAEHVARLRHLCRLVRTGHRPGQVVPLSSEALDHLLANVRKGSDSGARSSPLPVAPRGTRRAPDSEAKERTALGESRLSACLKCITDHDPAGLRAQLMRAIVEMGLEGCVLQLVAPLTQQVGQAWAEGRFELYEEHLYTECVTGVLRAAIGGVPTTSHVSVGARRVLLTTAPREPHGLGLLMLEAVLALRGFVCLPLGTQMPVADIARAAQVFHCDVVAMSFSSVLSAAQVHLELTTLRGLLPAPIQIWAGGQGTAGLADRVPGVRVLSGLSDAALVSRDALETVA